MSLINDALKRAGKQQKDGGAGQSGGGSPMTPAENSPGSKPSFVLLGLLLICLIGGGYYFMKWKEAKAKTGQAKAPPPKAAATSNGILGAAALIHGTTNLVGQIRSTQGADSAVQQKEKSTNLVAQIKTNVLVAAIPPPAVETKAEAPSPSPPISPPPGEPVRAPVASPVPTGPFPTLKLQGIFYRLKNPTVLINGETLKIGQLIDGARVVEINRLSAKVEWNGQTKSLFLAPE